MFMRNLDWFGLGKRDEDEDEDQYNISELSACSWSYEMWFLSVFD